MPVGEERLQPQHVEGRGPEALRLRVQRVWVQPLQQRLQVGLTPGPEEHHRQVQLAEDPQVVLVPAAASAARAAAARGAAAAALN